MATAPVAAPGAHLGSKARNQVSPFASVAVKPGCAPDDFSRISTHFDGSGGAPTFGPRASSSALIGREPIRLVNQLESGTSSMVLMFFARNPVGSYFAVTNRLYTSSYICDWSYGAAFDASCDSGS